MVFFLCLLCGPHSSVGRHRDWIGQIWQAHSDWSGPSFYSSRKMPWVDDMQRICGQVGSPAADQWPFTYHIRFDKSLWLFGRADIHSQTHTRIDSVRNSTVILSGPNVCFDFGRVSHLELLASVRCRYGKYTTNNFPRFIYYICIYTQLHIEHRVLWCVFGSMRNAEWGRTENYQPFFSRLVCSLVIGLLLLCIYICSDLCFLIIIIHTVGVLVNTACWIMLAEVKV